MSKSLSLVGVAAGRRDDPASCNLEKRVHGDDVSRRSDDAIERKNEAFAK